MKLIALPHRPKRRRRARLANANIFFLLGFVFFFCG
jgi:hypothetical protein